ncbi:hypothetical protein [Pacificoceanicola onchidii]|uniref:hypothetical protein n=1 Tax=Pacificoceanicola onchidii TaxID=2562685 RepID=UPI0010A536A4|nr:hypothetical protein [Pacificoceanicola onchidii]
MPPVETYSECLGIARGELQLGRDLIKRALRDHDNHRGDLLWQLASVDKALAALSQTPPPSPSPRRITETIVKTCRTAGALFTAARAIDHATRGADLFSPDTHARLKQISDDLFQRTGPKS